jgi:hypothetical protein
MQKLSVTEAGELPQKVALLEGELTDVHQTQDTVVVNFQGLSNRASGIDRWWEDAVRQCQDQAHELTLL